ncbi:hypothetical protein JCM24511_01617 [Saitozyma sp. JCM 24511]|nr:hypothetical protein JCM24511_01617 [Saitozyma sp. JCM 24511]
MSPSDSSDLFISLPGDSRCPEENWACNMVAIETLEHQRRQVPTTCGPWEAIVCPKRTGICGSDMHILLGHTADPKSGFKSFVLGHESSGIVAKGGTVAVPARPGSGEMNSTDQARHVSGVTTANLDTCEFMRFAAAGLDGTLQGYYTLPADLYVARKPQSPVPVSSPTHTRTPLLIVFDQVLQAPRLAVNAVATVAEMRPTANVAVFGAGPVGLLTMAVARALGARRVIAIDVQQGRLDFARAYAATDVHLASPLQEGESKGDYSKRHAGIIKDKFVLGERGPSGIDLVLDCSGAEVCIQTGLWLVKRRGKYVQVGNSEVYINVPLRIVMMREINIKGSFRRLKVASPRLRPGYSFRDADKAFGTTKAGKGPDGRMAIKVIIEGPES